MKKLLALTLAVFLLAAGIGAFAEEGAANPAESVPAAEAQEAPVTTQHTAVIGGQTLSYQATAGKLAVTMDDAACEMFYTAYMLDGVEDISSRPIAFAFNGGPGSSSEWLHLGFLGPRRIDFDEDGVPKSFPARLVDSEYSLLDLTDIVFIDPVGTGYSRALPGVDPTVFYGYDNDIHSVAEFIRLYVSQSGRWSSPKYLIGESYGTTRAVGLCDYLYSAYNMGLNGLMLISTANDFSVFPGDDDGNDIPYVLFMPTFTAAAWYHGMLDQEFQSMPLEDLLREVRDFAANEYMPALFKGTRLSDEERDAMAERLAAYTGLKKDFVLRSNLRISGDAFCMELLADQKLVVGRIDSRYTGPATTGSIGDGESDPSDMFTDASYGAAINAYLHDELSYHTDTLYDPLSLTVNEKWDYNRKNDILRQQTIIHDIMSRNSFLKVWVLCGYYDLATPFFSAEWVYDHVFLNDNLKENLSFTYYPSGHMIYLHEPSLVQLRQDAEAWFGK